MKIKTIIADDEYFIRAKLVKLINDNRKDIDIISICEDGKEVIDLLKKENIDLVITDIKMTINSGLDIAKYVYENNLNTKIIILSGYNDFEYARIALKYGVRDYLSKPLSLDELLLALDKCISSIIDKTSSKEENLANLLKKLEHLFDINKSQSPTTSYDISHIRTNINKFFNTNDTYSLEQFINDEINIISNNYNSSSLYKFIREIIASIDIKYHILNNKSLFEYINEHIIISDMPSIDELKFNILTTCKDYLNLNTYSTKEQIIYNNILKEIENNFTNNNFSVKDIGLSLNKNPSYLNSIFKKIAGFSISKAINNYKLEKAKFLLKTDSKKINEIADICGFNDMFYFSKKYKEKYGYPPSEEILKQ